MTVSATAAASPETQLGLLRNGSFVRLCIGQGVSAVGDKLSSIAIVVWILSERGDGPAALGVLFAVRTLAASSLLLIGGVLSDRLPVRVQVIGALVVLGATMVTLALLPGGTPLLPILALLVISGAADALLVPASQVLLFDLAGPERLGQANSISTLSIRVAGLFGPALGGVLVVTLGVQTAFLIDAATFGLGAMAVASTGPLLRHREVHGHAGTGRLLRDATEGLRMTMRTPWLRAVLLSDLTQTFLAVAPWFVLLPIALVPRGTAGYALTISAFAVGGLLGAAVPLMWRPRAIGRAALVSQALFAFPLAALAIGPPLPWIVGAAVIGGFGADLGSVLFMTGMQRGVPKEMLGRVTALSSLGSVALVPAGLALAGLLVDLVGIEPILMTGVLVILVATPAALLTPGVADMGEARSGP